MATTRYWTYELAMAAAQDAAQDAANMRIRKGGRKKWSLADRNHAAETFHRLFPLEAQLRHATASNRPADMSSPISVSPRLNPLSITLHSPDWDGGIVLHDLDAAKALGRQLLDAVKLLEYQTRSSGRPTPGKSLRRGRPPTKRA